MKKEIYPHTKILKTSIEKPDKQCFDKGIYLILHNIRSAYNVGSIFRTADGMGASKVFLTGYTPAPNKSGKAIIMPAEKMIAKTALGAEKNVPWEKAKSIGKLIKKLKNENIKIVAVEQSAGSLHYKKFKSKLPLALILGNEVRGINKKILIQCDEIIEIPMRGKKNSLNVAVAAGVAGYEIAGNIKYYVL